MTGSGGIDWSRVSEHAGPHASPGFRFWRDFMRWQRRLNELLRPLGLTQPQFAILATIGWLSKENAEVEQQDLSDFLGLERMHVSQVVSRLERQGAISRRRSENDARANVIALTEEGVGLLSSSIPIVEDFDHSFFAGRSSG